MGIIPYLYYIRVAIAIGFLIPAAIIDHKTRRVPNTLTFPMMVSGLLLNIFFSPHRLPEIGAALLICLLFGMLPGVGMGDIKLLMGMCMYLTGINTMLALALASILVLAVRFIHEPKATLWMVFLRRLRPISKEEASYKSDWNSVPFAPYLLCAVILVEGGLNLVAYFHS